MVDDFKPIRIQRRRTKGWRMPPNTIYVGRGTQWGNPFKIGGLFEMTPARVVNLYRIALQGCEALMPLDLIEFLHPLQGKNLACWCPLDQKCHADVLIEFLNRPINLVKR